MTPERLQVIDEIFQSALDLAPEARGVYLAQVRADDPELHAEVDSLLGAHERAVAFIEAPAAEAAAALLAATPIATRVGTYTIEAPLGAGGMGEVYRAVDRMGRRIALKTLAPRYVSDPKHVSRFLQEARAVLALNHPNVVTVYDIGEADGVYYIASELIEGETLRDVLRNRAPTLDELLDIAAQAATGIAAAHAKGIVHRDIKPENVMVRSDGFVKVLDFGIAKLTEAFDRPNEPAAQTALTREGLVIGTAAYMSPEQARGANVDARSDVWSLGVMLYEMVTGVLPFPGDTPADVIGRIIEREPLPLAHFVDSPPAGLQSLVTRALTKDSDARFQTMAEVIVSLKALRQELAFAAKLERLNLANPDTDSTGPKPFVFVCYAHADAARVYPYIERLRADGIELWFDRGIRAGSVWRQVVGEALDRATHILFFVSASSLRSEHCDPEVQYALDKRKVVVPVFLERTELSPQLRVPLSRVQALYCDRMSARALHDALRDAILSRHPSLTTPAPVVSSRIGVARRRRSILTASVAVVLSLAIAGSWWFTRIPHTAPLPTQSIAVLPFTAMSDDPKLRHLSEAVVEELLNDLAAERQLRVVSRTSASSRPAGQSVSAFAAALGVSYVLEGSLRPTSNAIRVTVQLIRGRDDVHLLSRPLDIADSADVSDVAREIEAFVTRYVENDADIARARTETTNDEAFGYYEKVARLDPSGEEADTNRVGREQALIYLDKAIALDPEFAEPYWERLLVLTDSFVGEAAADAVTGAEIRRLLNRYLELRPDSAMGWTHFGNWQLSDGDLAAAEKSYRRARELNPDFPWPLSQLGHIAVRRGRLDEAADYLKQSTLDHRARPSHRYYGLVLLNLKRFDEAERELDIALRVDPTDVEMMVWRVVCAYLSGAEAEAKTRFDAAWAKYEATDRYWFVGVMPIGDREQELREWMKQWDDGTAPANAAQRFWAHYSLGEDDQAIEWLIQSFDDGSAKFVEFIRAGAVLERLRVHPRFAEVLAKLDASEVTH
jgi:serine/threonine protein kinase/TolB-like protein